MSRNLNILCNFISVKVMKQQLEFNYVMYDFKLFIINLKIIIRLELRKKIRTVIRRSLTYLQ